MTEYEPIPDADPIYGDRAQIIQEVVLKWPSACLAGRLEAATAMNRDGWTATNCFEYIREHHLRSLPLFLERCGWREKVEEPVVPPLELRLGMWLEHPSYNLQYRVLGWREGDVTRGVMHSARHESGDHVHLMTPREPHTTYGSLYWVREECKEIEVDIVKKVTAVGADTPPYREDFTDHVDWVWNRQVLIDMDIHAEATRDYEDGTLVRLWYIPSRNEFTCQAWGANERRLRRSWYWTTPRMDDRPW